MDGPLTMTRPNVLEADFCRFGIAFVGTHYDFVPETPEAVEKGGDAPGPSLI